jgi:hypothetical protein
MTNKRYAVVTGFRITKEQVAAYLPANYRVNTLTNCTDRVYIIGEDNAGWTLDDYVIPRLASGNLFCKETTKYR